MPIKPENKKLYPANWNEIRALVLELADNQCEFCGVENYAIGYRDDDGNFHKLPGLESEIHALDGKKPLRIVLTVAHLDHNPANNDRSNLRALCQKCHLSYDAKHHAVNARKTRLKKKADRDLFDDVIE